MAWAWILCKQIEAKLSLIKFLILTLLIAVIANVVQYLVSGPYFLGYSGVVCGMVGFIWMRQKVAPWEGYTLHKSTIIFILVFILAMFALEIFSLILQAFSSTEISANIANTAHIVGGLSGILLAKTRFFKRKE